MLRAPAPAPKRQHIKKERLQRILRDMTVAIAEFAGRTASDDTLIALWEKEIKESITHL